MRHRDDDDIVAEAPSRHRVMNPLSLLAVGVVKDDNRNAISETRFESEKIPSMEFAESVRIKTIVAIFAKEIVSRVNHAAIGNQAFRERRLAATGNAPQNEDNFGFSVFQ